MMQVTVHQAKTQLSRLIEKALQGEEIVIARRSEPVVRLQPVANRRKRGDRAFGSMKGLVQYMAPDFNDPLEDFREYMEAADEPKARRARRKRS